MVDEKYGYSSYDESAAAESLIAKSAASDDARLPKRSSFSSRKRRLLAFTFILTSILFVAVALRSSLQSQVSEYKLLSLVQTASGRSTNYLKSLSNNRGADTHPDPKLQFVGDYGAVACDVPECSKMGVSILQQGGSAVDAAVTVALCIGSINSFSSGIGGGGFMTVRHPNGTALAFNFREMAPKLAHQHMYDKNPDLSRVGGLAVAVPGELAGLEAAFSRFTSGNLTWQQLFEPVIELNKKGFVASELLAGLLDYQDGLAKSVMSLHPDQWSWLFNETEDRFIEAGETVRRPALARTLELVAKHGAGVFYDADGPIVPHLVHTIRKMGGIVLPEDFTNYKVSVEKPLNVTFRGREVLVPGNPGSGPVLVQGLQVLEKFADNEGAQDLGPVPMHRLIETMKWMAAGRTELGDPVGIDNSERVDEISSAAWADYVHSKINDNHTLPGWQDYEPSFEQNDEHGTSHFSVLDKDGMAVGMTTTVNLLFGAMIADPVTGVVLNDEMDDFSVHNTSNAFELRPSIYNYVHPFKRPLSSTTPTIVSYNGKPELIIGASGGSKIVTSTFQAIVRVIDYGMPLLDTIARPRVHHQLLPNYIYMEYGDEETDGSLQEMRVRGHDAVLTVPSTAMNGIYRKEGEGKIVAVSDWWRKRGLAWGY